MSKHRKPTRIDTYTLPTRALLAAVLGTALLLGPVVGAGTADAHDGAESHQHMVMCTSEGLSPVDGPCMWDARHQGNGEGRSTIVYKSSFKHVSHRRAHRVLMYWRGQV